MRSFEELEELATRAAAAVAQAFASIKPRLAEGRPREQVATWLAGVGLYLYWTLCGEGAFSGPSAAVFHDRLDAAESLGADLSRPALQRTLARRQDWDEQTASLCTLATLAIADQVFRDVKGYRPDLRIEPSDGRQTDACSARNKSPGLVARVSRVMKFTTLPANSGPMSALTCDGEAVVSCGTPRPIDVAFTPEAILASLEGLRSAAELALQQQRR